MKKVFCLLIALVFLSSSYGSASLCVSSLPVSSPTEIPPLNAKDIKLLVGNKGTIMSLMDMAYISVQEYEAVAGQKMKIWTGLVLKLPRKTFVKS